MFIFATKDLVPKITMCKNDVRYCKEIEEQEEFDNCESPYDFKKEREV
jgi:hypothetical protein